jgi:uncharacterized protein YukE
MIDVGPPPAGLLPVEFDFAAAEAAVAALRRAATVVDRAAQRRANALDRPRADWAGPHRRAFDQAESDLAAKATALVDRMRRSAGDIAGAADDARRENRRRATALADWRDDRRRELEREPARP